MTAVACEQESKKTPENDTNNAIELADIMLRMQIHMDKLHFALKLKNQPLAAFYVDELGEALEEIMQANLREENVALSPLVKNMVVPKLEIVEQNISEYNPDLLRAGYLELLESCNNCHRATNHGFIRIIVPERPALANQEYGTNAVE